MRKTPLRTGHYYHVYNRGVNRQPIFFNKGNWRFFMQRLQHYCRPEWIEVLAYCLMPNHYHLLIYAKTDDLGIKVMHPLTVSYAKAVNKQQGRAGHLFQGPFQVRLVDRQSYLTHLTRYFHRNPVDAALVHRPEDWEFSSYHAYRRPSADNLCRPEVILSQFPSRAAYLDYVAQADTYEGISHLLLETEFL